MESFTGKLEKLKNCCHTETDLQIHAFKKSTSTFNAASFSEGSPKSRRNTSLKIIKKLQPECQINSKICLTTTA